jgi:hypothetical protein
MQIPLGAWARKLIHAVMDNTKESSPQKQSLPILGAQSGKDRAGIKCIGVSCAAESSENPPDVENVAQAHLRQDSETDVGLGKSQRQQS